MTRVTRCHFQATHLWLIRDRSSICNYTKTLGVQNQIGLDFQQEAYLKAERALHA